MMLKGALLGLPCAMTAPSMVRAESFYPDVWPRQLVLPQDHGSHPLFRTELWYLTGWLGEGESAMGFQLTFFRSRTRHNPKNPSRFAPTQLLFAHGAVADTAQASLRHAERSGRLGRAALHAAEGDTDLRFEDWRLRRLERAGRSVYEGRFAGEGFSVEFEATAGQPPILRGVDGFSSKGPRPEHASHYYSQAPLTVRAKVGLGQSSQLRSGLAWLDHEWSSQLLMPGGVGWDWIGINLLDGGTLMAFRIRDDKGQTLYSHADARGGGWPLPVGMAGACLAANWAVALTAFIDSVPPADGPAAGAAPPGARPIDAGPGGRRAGEHRRLLLGGCGGTPGAGSSAWSGLPGADRIRGSAAALKSTTGRVRTSKNGGFLR